MKIAYLPFISRASGQTAIEVMLIKKMNHFELLGHLDSLLVEIL